MQIHRGFIQCFATIQGHGPHNSFYEDQQAHLWEIGQSQPITNALQQFPAIWVATGSGDSTDDNGVGTIRRAQWFRVGAPKPTQMQVRLTGNTIIVGAADPGLALAGGIHISQQQTINGQAQTPGYSKVAAPALLPLPQIEWDAGHGSPFFTRLTEKHRAGSFGPLQPGYAHMGQILWRIEFQFS